MALFLAEVELEAISSQSLMKCNISIGEFIATHGFHSDLDSTYASTVPQASPEQYRLFRLTGFTVVLDHKILDRYLK